MIMNFLPFRSVYGSGDYPVPSEAVGAIPQTLSAYIPDREIYDGLILSLPADLAVTSYAYISSGSRNVYVFVEYLPEDQPVSGTVRCRIHIDPFATMRARRGYALGFEKLYANRISVTGVAGIPGAWNLPTLKSFENQSDLYYYSTRFVLLALAEGNFYGSDIKQQIWFRTEPQSMADFYSIVSAVGLSTRITDTRGSTTGAAYFENVKVTKMYLIPAVAFEHSEDTAAIGTALWWGSSDYRALAIKAINPIAQEELPREIVGGGMITVGNRVSNVSFEADPYKIAHWDIFVSLIQNGEKPAVLFVCDALGGMGVDLSDSLTVDFQQGEETQQIGLQKMRDAIQTASGVATLVGGVVTTVATGNPAGLIASGVGIAGLGSGLAENRERTWPRQNLPGGFSAAWPGARMEQTTGFQIYRTPYSPSAIHDLERNGGTACVEIPSDFSLSGDAFLYSNYFFIQGFAEALRTPFAQEETQLSQMQLVRLAEGVRFVHNAFQ